MLTLFLSIMGNSLWGYIKSGFIYMLLNIIKPRIIKNRGIRRTVKLSQKWKKNQKKNNSNLSCSDDNPNQRNHQQLQHWLNAPTTWPSKETSLPSELLPEPTFNLQRFTNEIVLLKEQIQDLPAEIEAIKHSMTEQMYSSNKSLIDMNGNTEPEYCVNIWVKMGQSWGKCIKKWNY